ncbi:MAG: hydrogenase maturation protease [Anaerolineales bacterium]|nr:hydrogenase maturation protease [Anaerolineales bacterium]
MKKTLVIGLGNPILGDDGVGWKVAEAVKELLDTETKFRLPVRPSGSKTVHYLSPIEVECLSLGGLSLMEHLLGYERAIIVDSMETGQSPAGSVQVFPLASLPDPTSGHSASAHDTSLMTALKTAEVIGADIPRQVDVVAIEAQNVYDFSEELSPPVAAAIPEAVQAVLDLLQGVSHDLS